MKNTTAKGLLGIAALLSLILVVAITLESMPKVTPAASCELSLDKDLLDAPFEFLSADNKNLLAWNHETSSLTRFKIETTKGQINLVPYETSPLICETAKENCLPHNLFDTTTVLEPVQFWNNDFGVVKAKLAKRIVYLPVMWNSQDILRIGSPLGLCQKDMATNDRAFTYSNGLLVTTFPEYGAYGYYNMTPFYSGVPMAAPRHPNDLWSFQKNGWAQADCSSLQSQQMDLVLSSSNNFVSMNHFVNFQGQTHHFMSTKGTLFELSGPGLPHESSEVTWLDANTAAISSLPTKWTVYKAQHLFDFSPIGEIDFEKPTEIYPIQQSPDYIAVEKPQSGSSQSVFWIKNHAGKLEKKEFGELPGTFFTSSPKLVWAQNFNDTTVTFLTKKEKSLKAYQISCGTSDSL